MKQYIHHYKISIVMGFTAFCFVTFYFANHNWMFHARVNLALHGYVFCRLESPSQIKELPVPRPTEFIAKYVYKGGTYIGYINPFGRFTEASRAVDDWKFQAVTNVVLQLLEWAFFCFFILCFLYWFHLLFKDRRAIGIRSKQ